MGMKKSLLICSAFLTLLFIASCNKDKCVAGDSYQIGKERKLDGFTGIEVQLSAIVELVKDTVPNTPFIEFVVEGNLEQHIATNIQDSVLSISLDKCFNEHQDITIRIHYDTLSSITINGPGDVKSNLIMVQDELNLNILSSGDIILTTDIQQLNTTIQGNGNIFINGHLDRHNLNISGSGSFNAYQATSDTTTINNTGSGQSFIRSHGLIQGNLTGSGNLYYKGFGTVNVNSSGSGQVINEM